jgi:hypothetical protein
MTLVSGEIVYDNGTLKDGSDLEERYQEMSDIINEELFY